MFAGLTLPLVFGLGLGSAAIESQGSNPATDAAKEAANEASKEAPAQVEPPASSAKGASAKSSPEGPAADFDGAPSVAADQALEVVLDCGLRLLIARDRTLPVAAVVLALESGPEDDPEEYPGLVHALAYHLLHGNRELRPGESIDTVHAGGGVSSLAIGLAQIRFESVLPASRLEEVLWIESQRLRSPTVSKKLWKKTIGWAKGDRRRPGVLSPAALAAVHGVPGLAHDARRPGAELASINEAALAAQLRTRFSYAQATLVVVAPNEPGEVLAMVEPLFADLPRAQRKVRRRLAATRRSPEQAAAEAASSASAAEGGQPASATEPGRVPADGAATAVVEEGTGSEPAPSAAPAGGGVAPGETPTGDAPGEPPTGETPVEEVPIREPDPEVIPVGPHKVPIYAWSVPGDPAANAWATAVCRTLNRQRRTRAEPKALRVKCAIDSDVRRTSVLVQVVGASEPLVALRERLGRLTSKRGRSQLRSQARSLARELHFAAHHPLGLARQLAISTDTEFGEQPQVVGIDTLSGAAALADVDTLAEVFPAMLHLSSAVVLVRPKKAKRKGKPIPKKGTSKPVPSGGDS